MGLAKFAGYIGKRGTCKVSLNRNVESSRIPVDILDAREVWGAVHLLVVPIGGEGEAWVQLQRVRIEGAK